jgi:hypothetical protein
MCTEVEKASKLAKLEAYKECYVVAMGLKADNVAATIMNMISEVSGGRFYVASSPEFIGVIPPRQELPIQSKPK